MKTTLLCILDGLGLNPNPEGNAVHLAKKPTLDALMTNSPHSSLVTFGERVGLPAGQMGNSEVGHLNIGAGREVEQWLLKISRGLAGPFLSDSKEYNTFIKAVDPTRSIHVVGLYSSGGVHSDCEHLKLLITRLSKDTSAKVILHLISDGRDVSPTSFHGDLTDLVSFIGQYPTCAIGSICGRFFAMDRDKRWERVAKAYDAIALGRGTIVGESPSYTTLLKFVKDSYATGLTDEFLEPAIATPHPIEASDALLFWNFRADRMREIVGALACAEFPGFARSAPIPAPERVLCFTDYDSTFHLPYLFQQEEIKNHLGEVVAAAGLNQLRVAETEKYPHVTYFLNGGVEVPYTGEDRQMVPSPRDVKTYDLKPEMSAFGVTEIVVEGIRSGKYSLIVVNLANCDMVGHTGVVEAAIKAVETADTCLGQMLAALREVKGDALVIADHGNAEMMINYEDGTPHTAHTTFPVPVILVDHTGVSALRDGGALCDVAPTVLKMMGLPQPKEMTGKALY
jgi:2,3-bisphosphoglycerate-independent phosphoglycerate mutase